jgi:hypothetical protein
MARRCMRHSLPNYFNMRSYHWNVWQNTVALHWWMNEKNNVTSCTECSLPQSIVHILIQPCFCLKFVFIEMLDKLITYIVCWYKTLYQVLPVAWTNLITTRRVILVHTTGSTWYKVLYHHTMYVMVFFSVDNLNKSRNGTNYVGTNDGRGIYVYV